MNIKSDMIFKQKVGVDNSDTALTLYSDGVLKGYLGYDDGGVYFMTYNGNKTYFITESNSVLGLNITALKSYQSGTSGISQAVMNINGLTLANVENLLAGRYSAVRNAWTTTNRSVYTYSAMESSTYGTISIYLTNGTPLAWEGIELVLDVSAGTWTINKLEG